MTTQARDRSVAATDAHTDIHSSLTAPHTSRLRVLMLSWEYPPHIVGGLGNHVMELVPALLAMGVDVELFTPRLRGGAATETQHGIPADGTLPGTLTIYRIEPAADVAADFFTTAWQTNLKMQEAALKRIAQAQARGQRFDIIHVHDWLVAFAGAAVKQHFQIPLVSTIHATERGRGRGGLHSDQQRQINNVEWFLTYESWRVNVCSNFMLHEVMNYFETPLDKIDVIPNGVDTRRFDVLDGADYADFRLNYAAPQQKIVLYVGRVVEEKGLRVIIEAAPQISAALDGDVKFVVVGSGPQLNEFRTAVVARGIDNMFYFTGFVTDSVRDTLLKVADVAVFPSLYEPFGIVALEAMAAKVPVVVSDIGGLTEVVTNYETGLKVYPNNLDSLAWGVLHTLQQPDAAQERVRKAYAMVKNTYNWHRIAAETLGVYRRVLQEQKASGWGQPPVAGEQK